MAVRDPDGLESAREYSEAIEWRVAGPDEVRQCEVWGGVSEPSETPVFIGFREVVHPFCIQFWGNLECS